MIFRPLSLVGIGLLAAPCFAHMGIQVVPGTGGVVRDQVALGDPFRYPNAGTCHNVNKPSSSLSTLVTGTTYSFPMSFGASHDGGHCAMFVTKGFYTGSNTLYKINDQVDCTSKGAHRLTLPTNLPPECATGCSLVWFWTPRSSGTCEIYSNCIDFKATGTMTGTITAGVAINAQPSCTRIDGSGLSPNYGKIIMDDGNNGGGGGGGGGGGSATTASPSSATTAPPSGSTAAPPTAPPPPGNRAVDCTATKTKCQTTGCNYQVAVNQCWGDVYTPTVICKCNDGRYPFTTPDGGKVYKGDAAPANAATSFGPNTAFGPYIEGAAVDRQGYVYAVNYNDNKAAIGRVKGDGSSHEQYHVSPDGGEFNGIRVHASGDLLLADYKMRRVVRVAAVSKQQTLACSLPDSASTAAIDAPNDLELTNDGQRLYLSGQNYGANTGGLYFCPSLSASTQAVQLDLDLKQRTNGIALSPADDWLFVSEAGPGVQRIWKYRTSMTNGVDVSSKILFHDFATDSPATTNIDIDGMRTDVAGNLYVTRNGGKAVVRLNDAGVMTATIALELTYPTNLDLGGSDGRTLYIVGRCGANAYGTGKGCLNQVRVSQPGRAWSYQTNNKPASPTSAPAPTTAAPSGGSTSAPASPTTGRVPTTASPNPKPSTPCVAVPPYNNQPGMLNWCNTNCFAPSPFCPSTHCDCSSAPQAFKDGSAVFAPSSGVYEPVCQQYVANGTMTLAAIGDKFDFFVQADYELLLLQTNYDKATGVTDLKSVVPDGVTVYIPGDCNLGTKALNTNIKLAGAANVAAPTLTLLAALFAAVFALFAH